MIGRNTQLHYHSICYMGDNGKMRSGVVQLVSRQVTRPTLQDVRLQLGFDENAVLVSHSYLGRMSQAEYESGDIKAPSVLMHMLMMAVAVAGVLVALKLM